MGTDVPGAQGAVVAVPGGWEWEQMFRGAEIRSRRSQKIDISSIHRKSPAFR